MAEELKNFLKLSNLRATQNKIYYHVRAVEYLMSRAETEGERSNGKYSELSHGKSKADTGLD